MASRWLRLLVSVSLAGAAGLTFAAAWQRWWPACPRGGFDSAACLAVQSHEYDYLVPSDPWVPIGRAAELAGASLLVLAVAAAVLPLVLRPGPLHAGTRLLVVLTALVPAAGLTLLGLVTLRAGMVGHPVAPDLPVLTLGYLACGVFWPAALVWLAATRPRPRAAALTTAVLVALATPIPALLVLGPLAAGYTSYDTAPWSEAGAAPVLLAAAVAVWAVRRPRATPPPADRSLPTVRHSASA
ncbi:hypothetical protein E8D34_00985 [Nocardioides sp. GY 10113]|uniref:hypothetical protein n=1 Tax=Nocardioides sp. GY 10113 TaxID=2569761 RepID=UPI0010A850EB|nr:hypothetical protein [Nocardioides sp. GY 10113]TIC89111.1 hypothetical protein E8D34_00985 [Nocardioides sp. GY 10113]